MTVDILNHEFVPKHEILSKSDVSSLLEKLSATKEKLPKIFVSDPVMKQLQAKQGDVVKIMRKSRTAGETVYYRVVV